MLRRGAHAPRRTQLDDPPLVHHGGGVAQILHHPDVVGDEEQRERALVAQVEQQLQHLRLHRYVERAGDFVAHHEVGTQAECAGDADALTLPPGELMRVSPQVLASEVHLDQRPCRRLQPVLQALADAVRRHRLGQGGRHREPRVERRGGVLEDELQAAAHGAHVAPAETGELASVEVHLTGGRLHQAQHRASERGLSAARLAHQREDLPPLDAQVDPVDRPHVSHRALEHALADGKVHLQPFEPDQHLRARGLAAFLRRCARPAP